MEGNENRRNSPYIWKTVPNVSKILGKMVKEKLIESNKMDFINCQNEKAEKQN